MGQFSEGVWVWGQGRRSLSLQMCVYVCACLYVCMKVRIELAPPACLSEAHVQHSVLEGGLHGG